MIDRRAYQTVCKALERQAAVALIGPRQVGKTTLARAIAKEREALYLDLETGADRNKLTDPSLFLEVYEDRLVVLDEIHRVPEIFQELRDLIDRGRQKGKRTGRFLALGSASMELLKQSGESLAGRIEYVHLNPLDLAEAAPDAETSATRNLWVRGGFPDSFLAETDDDSLSWRQNFIRTYLERDLLQLGPRIPAETLRRLWTMLAHGQGTPLNASKLAASLAVSAPTVTRYIDLLVDMLLVRRLLPCHANVGKRLVKSPKVYVRDSGLVHALLDLKNHDALSGHPVVGASWEGFVIENLLAAIPPFATTGFFRTHAGAEIDLTIAFPDRGGRWAIEIKRGLLTKPTRGFHEACKDVEADRSFVVTSGTGHRSLANGVEAVGLREMMAAISEEKKERHMVSQQHHANRGPATRFITDRLRLIRAGNDGWPLLLNHEIMVTHLVPLPDFGDVSRWDIGKVRQMRTNLPIIGHKHPKGSSQTENEKGLRLSCSSQGCRGYVQIYKDLKIESVSADIFETDNKGRSFRPIPVTRAYKNMLSAYVDGLQELGATPPILVVTSFFGVHGVQMADVVDPVIFRSDPYPSDTIELPAIDMNEYDANGDYDRFAAIHMDEMWKKFDCDRCHLFEDGVWVEDKVRVG